MTDVQFRTIEIDFEVHQLIELEKKGFHESNNEVLRRLLKLDTPPPDSRSESQIASEAWQGKGVQLPHGTELKMLYHRREYRGSIRNGKWFIEDQQCNSPSAAARIVAGGTSLNGWLFWQVKRPNDEDWKPLNSLR